MLYIQAKAGSYALIKICFVEEPAERTRGQVPSNLPRMHGHLQQSVGGSQGEPGLRSFHRSLTLCFRFPVW